MRVVSYFVLIKWIYILFGIIYVGRTYLFWMIYGEAGGIPPYFLKRLTCQQKLPYEGLDL